MDELTRHEVDEFLDRLADRTPTPGGGSATGLAGALACALARMVAAYSVGARTDASVAEQVKSLAGRLHRTDQLLRALVTQDARVYTDMTAAARAMRQDAAKKEAHQDSVRAAVAVPMEMAAIASNALSTMDELKSLASSHLLSDLGIAAVLADAVARTARYTVRVNTGELDDDAERRRFLTDVDATIAHCAARRESIEGFVGDRLEHGPAAGR